MALNAAIPRKTLYNTFIRRGRLGAFTRILASADESFDRGEFRQALAARNIKTRAPSKRNSDIQNTFDQHFYKARDTIESMFGKLKDY